MHVEFDRLLGCETQLPDILPNPLVRPIRIGRTFGKRLR